MKLSFSKRDRLILVVGVLLLVALGAYAQFLSLAPLKSELTTKQKTLKIQQDLLAEGNSKKQESISQTVEDSKGLQKNIPVKPLVDQFILDLEKAENISNSKIKTMGFSADAEVTASNNDQNAQNNVQQTGTDANQSTAGQQTSDPNYSTVQTPPPVSGLKKLTVTLSVESPDYESLEKFIHSLETLTRIVVIESINYSGGEEITSLSQEIQPMTYSLTISAFYMPDLADLISELPKIDVPEPAGKVNPLSQFSNNSNP